MPAVEVVAVGAQTGYYGQVTAILVGVLGESARHQLAARAVLAGFHIGWSFGSVAAAGGQALIVVIIEKAQSGAVYVGCGAQRTLEK